MSCDACWGGGCPYCEPEYPEDMCDGCPYADACGDEGPSEVCMKVRAGQDEAAQDIADHKA